MDLIFISFNEASIDVIYILIDEENEIEKFLGICLRL